MAWGTPRSTSSARSPRRPTRSRLTSSSTSCRATWPASREAYWTSSGPRRRSSLRAAGCCPGWSRRGSLPWLRSGSRGTTGTATGDGGIYGQTKRKRASMTSGSSLSICSWRPRSCSSGTTSTATSATCRRACSRRGSCPSPCPTTPSWPASSFSCARCSWSRRKPAQTMSLSRPAGGRTAQRRNSSQRPVWRVRCGARLRSWRPSWRRARARRGKWR
mmetsp:Transcript_21463/g.61143  ORF Transcript_21463/g.61143 Transcript_21463/m.61143 type:complete len:218 (+) Transcript_21463:650-1303(+)